MTIRCPEPDVTLGIAYRLSTYLDCQARALGENGFQAMAGGATGAAMLSAALTLFVALIGYRMMLGQIAYVRDLVGWVVRLGVVLALVTSWPSFQALVYQVAVDAPNGIASVLLPASRLSGESIDGRVQRVYDSLRLGAPGAGGAQPPETASPTLVEPAPKTASLLVIATTGLAGALRIAIGFLLAVAPLAIISLLFTGASGLFNGWLRALSGLALAVIGSTIVTAMHLAAIEGELAYSASATADPQALTTLVALFALVAVVTTLAGIRMGSALRLPAPPMSQPAMPARDRFEPVLTAQTTLVPGLAVRGTDGQPGQTRAAAVAEILSTAVHRERRTMRSADLGVAEGNRPDATSAAEAIERRERGGTIERIGVAGRRGVARRTRSADRRDKVA